MLLYLPCCVWLCILQANGAALDHSALAAITSIGRTLQRAHVLLVGRGSKVVHHAEGQPHETKKEKE